MTTTINLNPSTKMTLAEIEQKKRDLQLQKKELELKRAMGMPMTDKEYERLERVDALIDQCDFVIDWMTIENEEEYDWTID